MWMLSKGRIEDRVELAGIYGDVVEKKRTAGRFLVRWGILLVGGLGGPHFLMMRNLWLLIVVRPSFLDTCPKTVNLVPRPA
jgi:hypothetical protein